MIERTLDPLMWASCWLAYRLVMILPDGAPAGSLRDRLWFWLLPFTGFYGYHDPEFTPWRWSQRIRR